MPATLSVLATASIRSRRASPRSAVALLLHPPPPFSRALWASGLGTHMWVVWGRAGAGLINTLPITVAGLC